MQVFCSAFGANLDERAWIAIIIIPVAIFMVAITEMNSIVPFSLVANVFILYSLCCILVDGIYAFT